MKKTTLTLLLFAIVAMTSLFAQKPHFFIECNQAMGDTSQKYANAFARLVANELKDAFPCAKINTQSDIVNKLDSLRFRALIGDFEGDLPSFCDQLAHDYWIHLRMIDYTEGRIAIIARCFKYKKIDCIADAGMVRCGNTFGELTEGCKEITKRLIDMLSKFEICPFTGPVNLSIHSQFDTVTKQEYAVYCNMMDQTYRREETSNKRADSEWQLERKGIPRAIGTMNFTLSESSSLEVQNGCYKCQSGREGGRIYTRTNSFNVEGSGLSTESSYNGNKQDDTRIEIEFLEDGTYILTAKGTSKPARGYEKENEKAEGTCDNIPSDPRSIPKEITLPLKVILGPFPGKSTDEILQQNNTIKRRNPITNEMETITYDFTLEKLSK
ncbi:MAG: hypothetical protein IPH84_15610 [Bacteroidales bacterium]|nr:hypothetical protein [Bacteroidales bacterium]